MTSTFKFALKPLVKKVYTYIDIKNMYIYKEAFLVCLLLGFLSIPELSSYMF